MGLCLSFFWLCWVFLEACGLSPVAACGPLVVEHEFSCIWDLSSAPRDQTCVPALEGEFLTT